MPRRLLIAAALLGLGGCAGGGDSSCLAAGRKPVVVAQMFFGRAIPGRAMLSEAEWTGFADETIAAQFPDGFTSFDGDGRWRDPGSGAVIVERTKILVVAAEPGAALEERLAAIAAAYRARFDQRSVGLVT